MIGFLLYRVDGRAVWQDINRVCLSWTPPHHRRYWGSWAPSLALIRFLWLLVSKN